MDTQPPSQPYIERLLGANWRTTVSGLTVTLTGIIIALAALPADTWKNPSVAIPAVLLVVAKTIQDFKTKDANVSGTGAALDPHKVDDGIAMPRQIPPASLILAFVGISLLFSACAPNGQPFVVLSSLGAGATVDSSGDVTGGDVTASFAPNPAAVSASSPAAVATPPPVATTVAIPVKSGSSGMKLVHVTKSTPAPTPVSTPTAKASPRSSTHSALARVKFRDHPELRTLYGVNDEPVYPLVVTRTGN